MSLERTGRCRSSGGGGGPHGKTAFGNVPFRADGFFRFRCWCPVFSGTSDSGRMPARMFPTRVVRKLRVPERCRSMPPHLFGVGARMQGREVGREPALSGPVRAGTGKDPPACAADLLSAVARKRPAVVRPLRPSTGNPFLRDKRTVRPAVAGRSRRGTFVFRPVSRFVSLGRMPVQGGRKRPKGDLQKQVALRFMCPTVARRKIPRQGKPSGALVRAVGAGPTRDQLTDGRNEYSVEYSIIWAG